MGWRDGSGNLWLFGGLYQSASGYQSMNNDLWEFHPSSNEWTWVSGYYSSYSAGVYGTEGVASVSNTPGAREWAVGWTDRSGNFWLFGGFQIAYSYGAYVQEGMNDLWEFNPSTEEWTWVSGSNTGNGSGVYGSEGVEATTNVPGAREQSVGWTDTSGNLFLFGGVTSIAGGNYGYLSDLWKFDLSTGEWVWVSGVSSINGVGQYGTETRAAATNAPSARASAVSWTDASGNLWLFGGGGVTSSFSVGSEQLNDLWVYQP